MKKILLLLTAVLLFSGCASTFFINGADKIPENQRVKIVHDKYIAIGKIDDEWVPATARSMGSPQEYTYFLTPGAHIVHIQYITMEDEGFAIIIRPGEDAEFKKDTRKDPVELRYVFEAGKTYVINYTFPDEYSIKYSIEER
ncbi:MAG: hypothetical protein JW822_13455 [Spirochaetales bacterium]|nr:hypothetical protein [Spirochaetales bacterium]